MAYKALYRKWRPRVFEDLIGQDHIVTILKNQIKYRNIAHAYLFTGIRGTGKTSAAKIFARAVNCLNPINSNPCNECEICLGILSESLMDVIEIDAASNNGVDHIREIRENVKYPPSKGSFKVYIIDEVHMLSGGAFNALLKTLEEPPEHVIFVLATTEAQKIPATILSRCQRFDFKAIDTKDIMSRLNDICLSMGIECEEEALRIISINAEGALRDALSILEQCTASSIEKLTYDYAVHVLGSVNYDFLFSLTGYIAQGKTSKALEMVHTIVKEGKDVHLLIKDLIRHFRNLLMAKMEVDLEYILSLPKETLHEIKKQSSMLSSDCIINCLHILSETESKMKQISYPKIMLEVALIKLCRKEPNESLEGLIQRVKELENIMDTKNLNNNSKQDYDKERLALKNKPLLKKALSSVKVIEEKENTTNNRLDAIKSQWESILEKIKTDKKPLIYDNMKKSELTGLNENILTVSLKEEFNFYRDKLEKEKEYISGIIENITEQKVKLSFVLVNEGTLEKQLQMGDIVNKLNKASGNGLEEIDE